MARTILSNCVLHSDSLCQFEQYAVSVSRKCKLLTVFWMYVGGSGINSLCLMNFKRWRAVSFQASSLIVVTDIMGNCIVSSGCIALYVQVWSVSWCPRTMFSGGLDHPPLNVILRGPHSKISAKGPEFLATALRVITVSGSSTVYHLVFTPRLPFPYWNPTEEFFSTWRWKVFNRLLTNKSLFWIFHTRIIVPGFLDYEIHYPLWCGWEPVAKSTRQGW